MSFFKLASDLIGGAVEIVGEVAKVGVKLTGEVVSGATEVVVGQNEFSKGIRDVTTGLSELTDTVVDKAAVPLVKTIGTAPVRLAEKGFDAIDGTLSGDSSRAQRAVVGILVVAGTGAILGPLVADALDGIDILPDADADFASGDLGDTDHTQLQHVDAHLVQGHYRDGQWIDSYWRDGDGNPLVKGLDGYYRRA